VAVAWLTTRITRFLLAWPILYLKGYIISRQGRDAKLDRENMSTLLSRMELKPIFFSFNDIYLVLEAFQKKILSSVLQFSNKNQLEKNPLKQETRESETIL
jgi:hypothetical protein